MHPTSLCCVVWCGVVCTSQDQRLGIGRFDPKLTEPKEKRKFMQKYYHKGVRYVTVCAPLFSP